MIADVLYKVEDHFYNYWQGEIHFADTDKHPTADEWINLEVEPVYSEYLSYEGCQNVMYMVYVTCYARNKVATAKLADKVIAFLKNKAIEDLHFKGWRPVNQGRLHSGSYFRRVSFPIWQIN